MINSRVSIQLLIRITLTTSVGACVVLWLHNRSHWNSGAIHAKINVWINDSIFIVGCQIVIDKLITTVLLFIYNKASEPRLTASQLDIKRNNAIWGCQPIIVFLCKKKPVTKYLVTGFLMFYNLFSLVYFIINVIDCEYLYYY